MIKLTKHQPSEHEIVIRVDGRLDARALKDLQGLLGTSGATDAVSVELSGLTSVDPEGLAFLVGLRAAGCRLLGGSLYISRLLEEV